MRDNFQGALLAGSVSGRRLLAGRPLAVINRSVVSGASACSVVTMFASLGRFHPALSLSLSLSSSSSSCVCRERWGEGDIDQGCTMENETLRHAHSGARKAKTPAQRKRAQP